MKLFVKFLKPDKLKEQLKSIEHLDFSLFVDYVPENQEQLSPINIMVLEEPNEYFGIHDWVIKNKDAFTLILTWNDKVLKECSNSRFLGFGSTWFLPEQYEASHLKEFKISHLCGTLLKSYGHQMRHEVLDRAKEFEIPINFYDKIGDRHNENDARIGKETVFGNSQYGIAIENFSHRGYFTEKILDCFLLKTIPIYWGCSNIEDFFNTNGIIQFNNVDELIYQVNNLDEYFYKNRNTQITIEENYQTALKYISYEKNIAETIITIFKNNKLI